MGKQRLFISYSWKDGNTYADELETQLKGTYVKSLNCMLEMAYLVSQEEWGMRAMVLVIDDSLYSITRKFEVMRYWITRQKNNQVSMKNSGFGKALLEEEKEYIDLICENMEKFIKDLLNENGDMTLNELSEKMNRSKASTMRYISNLTKKGDIERVYNGEGGKWRVIKEQ